jgi:hypothetical protein
MECRCGAQFCYVCLGDPDECGGVCSEEEDQNHDSDDGPDDELDELEADGPVLPPNTSEAIQGEVSAIEAPATDAANTPRLPNPSIVPAISTVVDNAIGKTRISSLVKNPLPKMSRTAHGTATTTSTPTRSPSPKP